MNTPPPTQYRSYEFLRKWELIQTAGRLSTAGKVILWLFSCWLMLPPALFILPAQERGAGASIGSWQEGIFILPLLSLIPFLLWWLLHRAYLWLNGRQRYAYIAPLGAAWVLAWVLSFLRENADLAWQNFLREHQSLLSYIAVYLPLLLFVLLATWLEYRFEQPRRAVDILDDHLPD